MTDRRATPMHPVQAYRDDSTPDADRTLTVVAWVDATFTPAADAHVTASDDALLWYTPVLGPTAMLMAHRFAAHAAHGPRTWTFTDLAATFGLGRAIGRVPHVLARLERFAITCRYDTHTVGVRLILPPLSPRQLAQLPATLAAQYPTRAATQGQR
jgi:hypothetical protein